jgi:NAD(P)-dependent dehydrogenase (short-subunit alcohol dehydrogenase family)
MSDLAGLHIVVTGGAGALGRAVVEHLSVAGATCHAPSHDELDLTDETAVTSFYQRLPPLWASVQVAGGYAGGPFAVTSLADFRRQLEMNLTTCFLCCREAVRSIGRRVGGPEGGRIINIGSRAALHPSGGAIAYSVAKAGVAALTQCLADELKSNRILVNAVIPSIIDTPANRQAMPAAAQAAGDRWPKPSAIAGAILWLASPENQLVSGALLPVYGDT